MTGLRKYSKSMDWFHYYSFNTETHWVHGRSTLGERLRLGLTLMRWNRVCRRSLSTLTTTILTWTTTLPWWSSAALSTSMTTSDLSAWQVAPVSSTTPHPAGPLAGANSERMVRFLFNLCSWWRWKHHIRFFLVSLCHLNSYLHVNCQGLGLWPSVFLIVKLVL